MSGLIGTFGSSPTAKNLAMILEDHPRERAKIAGCLHDTSVYFKSVKEGYSSSIKGLLDVIYAQRKEHIKKYAGLTPSMLSHTLNVVSTMYKKELERRRRPKAEPTG